MPERQMGAKEVTRQIMPSPEWVALYCQLGEDGQTRQVWRETLVCWALVDIWRDGESWRHGAPADYDEVLGYVVNGDGFTEVPSEDGRFVCYLRVDDGETDVDSLIEEYVVRERVRRVEGTAPP